MTSSDRIIYKQRDNGCRYDAIERIKNILLRTYEYLLKKFINLSKKDKLNKLNIYKY